MTHISATVSHNGDPPFQMVARLTHTKTSDGVHVFKSSKIPGLLVMNKSLDRAMEILPVVIADLMQMNKGFTCDVSLGFDMEDQPRGEPDYAIINKMPKAA